MFGTSFKKKKTRMYSVVGLIVDLMVAPKNVSLEREEEMMGWYWAQTC